MIQLIIATARGKVMEGFLKMAEIQGVLLVYLIVGFIARKVKIITPETRPSYTNFVIYILLPCMIFMSFSEKLTSEQLRSTIILLLISFTVAIFSYILGKVIFRNYPYRRRSILQYGTLISNSAFAGMPMIYYAYGELGLFYASIYIIPLRILMWSAGISLFTEADFKTKLRNVILNPGIIAVELGAARMLLQIAIHPSLSTALKSVGNATMPMSMILIGTILAEISVRDLVDKDVAFMTVLRLILLPGIVLLALKAIGTDPLITAVTVLLTGMPVGSTAAILAEKYGADFSFGSKIVFTTTILSLITVPILSIFL